LNLTSSVTGNLPVRVAFFRGPDGELIELLEDKPATLENVWSTRGSTAPSFTFNCYGQATLPTNMYVAAG
jgi:hypothetical protein